MRDALTLHKSWQARLPRLMHMLHVMRGAAEAGSHDVQHIPGHHVAKVAGHVARAIRAVPAGRISANMQKALDSGDLEKGFGSLLSGAARVAGRGYHAGAAPLAMAGGAVGAGLGTAAGVVRYGVPLVARKKLGRISRTAAMAELGGPVRQGITRAARIGAAVGAGAGYLAPGAALGYGAYRAMRDPANKAAPVGDLAKRRAGAPLSDAETAQRRAAAEARWKRNRRIATAGVGGAAAAFGGVLGHGIVSSMPSMARLGLTAATALTAPEALIGNSKGDRAVQEMLRDVGRAKVSGRAKLAGALIGAAGLGVPAALAGNVGGRAFNQLATDDEGYVSGHRLAALGAGGVGGYLISRARKATPVGELAKAFRVEVRLAKSFAESEHPRGSDGKFSGGGAARLSQRNKSLGSAFPDRRSPEEKAHIDQVHAARPHNSGVIGGYAGLMTGGAVGAIRGAAHSGGIGAAIGGALGAVGGAAAGYGGGQLVGRARNAMDRRGDRMVTEKRESLLASRQERQKHAESASISARRDHMKGIRRVSYDPENDFLEDSHGNVYYIRDDGKLKRI